jgi:hypothetical protein
LAEPKTTVENIGASRRIKTWLLGLKYLETGSQNGNPGRNKHFFLSLVRAPSEGKRGRQASDISHNFGN